MTLAPRVEVFTQLACGTLHSHYNHTAILSGLTMQSADTLHDNSDISFYSPLAPYTMVSLGAAYGNDDGDDDPRVLPSKRCTSDPAVQAAAARLQTVMTTTVGALSTLTSSWWSYFGERHGRTRVLALSTFGLFLAFVQLIFFFISM
jgi:MFS family permease